MKKICLIVFIISISSFSQQKLYDNLIFKVRNDSIIISKNNKNLKWPDKIRISRSDTINLGEKFIDGKWKDETVKFIDNIDYNRRFYSSRPFYIKSNLLLQHKSNKDLRNGFSYVEPLEKDDEIILQVKPKAHSNKKFSFSNSSFKPNLNLNEKCTNEFYKDFHIINSEPNPLESIFIGKNDDGKRVFKIYTFSPKSIYRKGYNKYSNHSIQDFKNNYTIEIQFVNNISTLPITDKIYIDYKVKLSDVSNAKKNRIDYYSNFLVSNEINNKCYSNSDNLHIIKALKEFNKFKSNFNKSVRSDMINFKDPTATEKRIEITNGTLKLKGIFNEKYEVEILARSHNKRPIKFVVQGDLSSKKQKFYAEWPCEPLKVDVNIANKVYKPVVKKINN